MYRLFIFKSNKQSDINIKKIKSKWTGWSNKVKPRIVLPIYGNFYFLEPSNCSKVTLWSFCHILKLSVDRWQTFQGKQFSYGLYYIMITLPLIHRNWLSFVKISNVKTIYILYVNVNTQENYVNLHLQGIFV